MHYIWSYRCNISLKNIPKNNSEESRAGQSVEIRIHAHQDCNGFISLMLLVKKTPSSVSKVTSVTFRANQQGFNEKPLSCNCLGFKSTQPLCVSIMPRVQASTQLNLLLKSEQGTDGNEGFFFLFTAKNFTHASAYKCICI